MKLTRLRALLAEKGAGDPVLSALFTLAGDSAVYLAGSVMVGLGNFVLVPLYTRYLTPAEFGIYALVDVTILVLVTVTQLGLGVSYLKWFADLGEEQRDIILGSSLVLGILAALLAGSFLSIAVAGSLGERWLQTAERGFAWTLLPIIVLENVQGLFFSDLRARRKSFAFSASAAIRLLAILAASLWFIVAQRQRVAGVFLGRLVGDSIGVLMLATFSLRSIRLGFAWSVVSSMVRYGLPLTWSALMAMMLDASGRYFLSQYSTMEQVGFYGAAIKIGNIFQMLVNQPFGVAWGGLMFQIVKWPNARTIYSKIFAYVFLFSSASALILALFTPTLFAIFTTATYAPAMAVFPMILLVRAVNIMEYPTAIGIYLAGRTKWFAVIYSVGVGINVLANYLLVPIYGMFGAAWAWLVAWMVIIGLMARIGQCYYPLNYNWRSFLFPVVLWSFIIASGQWFLLVLDSYPLLQFLLAFQVVISVSALLVQDARATRKRLFQEKSGW